jgi:hypothetical protein
MPKGVRQYAVDPVQARGKTNTSGRFQENAMTRILHGKWFWALSIVVAFACPVGPSAAADSAGEEITKEPTWTVPLASEVKAQTFKWLDACKPDDAIRMQAESLWSEDKSDRPTADLLSRVVKTIALADSQTRELVDLSLKPKSPGPLPRFAFLTDDQIPAFERNNLRLWYGRWLALERLYDDSLAQLSGLEPGDVVDPASLLFFEATDNQWLLQKERGLKTLSRLLERKTELPRRYAQTGVLMQADLTALRDESLDHIDRRMRDVESRLDLGHAGKKVRSVEDGIIASLDRMIGRMIKDKEVLYAPGHVSGIGKGAKQSSGPAPHSARLIGDGDGEVGKKSIGNQSNWGELNPKEQHDVLQSIGKEYPSHYRDVIEQYFKRLAADD